MSNTIKLRTRKIPATDTAGAKIRVERQHFDNWRGRSYPYDFAAFDAHHAAVAQFVADDLPGITPPFSIAKGDVRRSGSGYFFTLTTGI